MDELIPEGRRGAVATALTQTFGAAAPLAASLMPGGLSTSPVLRIDMASGSFLLRLDRPRRPGRHNGGPDR